MEKRSADVVGGTGKAPLTSRLARLDALGAVFLVLRLVAALCLLANASLFFITDIQRVLYPYFIDYGEGPVLEQAYRLAHGLPIYQGFQGPPWLVANYPPLFQLLLAPFTLLFPPTFFFGRGLATLSAVVSGVLAGAIVYRLTRSRFAGLVTCLAFLGLYPIREWSGFARVDGFGLALVLGGLFALTFYLPDGPPVTTSDGAGEASKASLVVALLLLVAGGYTKQSLLLSGPAAACLYLLARSWRTAILFGATLVGIVVGLALVLQMLTGGYFLLDVVTANANTLSSSAALSFDGRLWRVEHNLFYASAAVLAYLAWKRRGIMVAAFAIFSLSSLVTIAKVGSAVNYYFELEAGLAMLLGLGVGYLAAHRGLPVRLVQAALLLAIAWQANALYQTDRAGVLAISDQLAQKRIADEVVLDRIRAANGPVVGDDAMGALYLLGRPIEIQPFEYSRLAIEGKWDQQPFVETLAQRRYALVVFTTRAMRGRYTPEMLQTIEDNYAPVAVAGGIEIWAPI